MNTIEESIEDFICTGTAGGWSTGTSKTYRWHLDRLAAWLAARQITDLAAITRSHIRSWSAGLRDVWSPATCKGAITAARSWLRWLQAEELTALNLSTALRNPRIPKRVQRTLSKSEFDALLSACEPADHGLTPDVALAVAVRNRAIVSLLYESLVRASELCSIQSNDLDLAACEMIIRQGKGGSDRLALFSPSTAALLRAWLAERPTASTDHLFVSLGGKTPGAPLTTRGLRIIVRRLAERAGIDPVSPHAFRRGGSVAYTLNGAPSRVVQQLAGWSSSRQLDTYTRAIADRDVIAAQRRYTPLKATTPALESAPGSNPKPS